MQTPFSPPYQLQALRISLALMLTGSALLGTGAITIRLYSAIRADDQQRIDQKHQAILSRVDYLKGAQDYSACITEAGQIPAKSLFSSQAKTLQEQCQNALIEATINRAQVMASAGQLKDAVAEIQPLLNPVSDQAASTASYQPVSYQTASSNAALSRVRQLIREWSNQILQVAEGYYFDPSGRFQEALQTASAIAPDNLLYGEAQTKIHYWQQEWLANQKSWQIAQAALNAHQLDAALLQVQKITHPYWNQQAMTIVNAVYAAKYTEATQSAEEVIEQPEPKPLTVTVLIPLGLSTLLILNCLRGK